MHYIRISPIDTYFYNFTETPNGQYTAIKFWHDLSSLNGASHNNVKIFVSHDTNHDVISEPVMFAASLTESDSLNEAIPKLVESIRNFLGSLSIHFNCSFQALHECSFTIATTASHDFSINELDLKVNNGVVSSVVVIDPKTIQKIDDGYEFKGTSTNVNYALKGSIKHDDYINSYFSVNHPDASNLNINYEMVQTKKLHSIGDLPSFESGNIKNTLVSLYNESLSCSVPSLAFSLLWQIIELIESNANATPIFDDDTLNKIKSSLNELKIDANLIQNRILGNLKGMKIESQPERFISGAKKLFPDWEEPDKVKNIFRKARKARGKLYHPRKEYDPYDKQLLVSYFEVKSMVKSFIKYIV